MRPLVLLLILTPALRAADPPITSAVFTPGGEVLVGSQAGLRLLSWPDLKEKGRPATRLEHVHDLAFAPGGDVLAVAGGSPGEQGVVELLRWPGGELLRTLTGHEDLVHAVAWSADGKQIATASADGSCRVFESATGRSVQAFSGHSGAVLAIGFLPGGEQVLSAGVDQSLRLWETATGKAVRAMENHTAPVLALAGRPNQPREALPVFASAGADRTIRLWQPGIGRMMRFRRLPAVPRCLAWEADGSRILAGCADGKVRVLDADTLDVLAETQVLTGWIHSLAASPKQGEALGAGESGQVRRIPRSD